MNVPGRGEGKCKGPEAVLSLAHLRTVSVARGRAGQNLEMRSRFCGPWWLWLGAGSQACGEGGVLSRGGAGSDFLLIRPAGCRCRTHQRDKRRSRDVCEEATTTAQRGMMAAGARVAAVEVPGSHQLPETG